MPSLEKKLIRTELKQRQEEGCDIAEIANRINQALEIKASDSVFTALYDELVALPVTESFRYDEPSSFERHSGRTTRRSKGI